MSLEANKALVRRYLDEVWNAQNLDLVSELFAEDYLGHDPTKAEPIRGPEGVRQLLRGFMSAFPDLTFTVEDQIAEGDKVSTRWVCQGTHQGPIAGIEPTGRQIRVAGMNIDRIVGGKIVERWVAEDHLGLWQQLGVISGPGH